MLGSQRLWNCVMTPKLRLKGKSELRVVFWLFVLVGRMAFHVSSKTPSPMMDAVSWMYLTYSYTCMSTKDDVGGRMLDSVLRCFSKMVQSRKEFHGPSFCFSHPGEVLILCWVSNPWWGCRQGHVPLTWASLPEPPHSDQAACIRLQHRAPFSVWLLCGCHWGRKRATQCSQSDFGNHQ